MEAVRMPETRYALNGDFHLAYQVLGEGPPDIVVVNSGPGSHIEHQWEFPAAARILRRLGSFSRLIYFDNRGAGLSDPVAPNELPTLEDEVSDIAAVLDAVGSARAVLLANLAGGAPASVFAATYPERVQALVMFAPWARLPWADDYQIGVPPETMQAIGDLTRANWGRGESFAFFAPSAADDVSARQWYAEMERLAASPRTAAAMVRIWLDVDVRAILPAVQVPTLVLARTDQPFPLASMSRYVAEHIPGAKYLEFPGSDSFSFVGQSEPLMDAIEDFVLEGDRRSQPSRWLGTVVFIDIVGSTELAARIGDERWGDLRSSFLRLVHRQLARFQGRLIDTAGDGVLAVFDRPAQAIGAARAIRDAVRAFDLQVRAGVHTGEMERLGDSEVGGIAVHIGARVSALAGPSEILVSRTVKDLVVGSGLQFADRGTHTLKGVPDQWQVFAVIDS